MFGPVCRLQRRRIGAGLSLVFEFHSWMAPQEIVFTGGFSTTQKFAERSHEKWRGMWFIYSTAHRHRRWPKSSPDIFVFHMYDTAFSDICWCLISFLPLRVRPMLETSPASLMVNPTQDLLLCSHMDPFGHSDKGAGRRAAKALTLTFALSHAAPLENVRRFSTVQCMSESSFTHYN